MTQTILRLDASARKSGSVTRDLTNKIVARFDTAKVITRDLTTALPQIDEAWIGANFTPADQRSDDQKALLALSDELVTEVQAADVVVIGLPVYNFTIPSALKAWIDLITRVGITFRYTENGPEGLLKGKRAIIAMASGGTKAGSDIDFASTYLRHILGFNGITDVELVAADAMSINAEATLKAANDAIVALAA